MLKTHLHAPVLLIDNLVKNNMATTGVEVLGHRAQQQLVRDIAECPMAAAALGYYVATDLEHWLGPQQTTVSDTADTADTAAGPQRPEHDLPRYFVETRTNLKLCRELGISCKDKWDGFGALRKWRTQHTPQGMPALVVLAGTWVNSHDEAVMQDQVDNVSSGHEFLQLMMQSLRMSMPSAGVLTIRAAHRLTLTKTPRSCIKALLPESHSVQMHCPPHSEPIHGTPMNVTAMLVGPGSMLLHAAQHHLSEQGGHLRCDAISLIADALLSKRYVLQLGANRHQLPLVIAQRLVNMVGTRVDQPLCDDQPPAAARRLH